MTATQDAEVPIGDWPLRPWVLAGVLALAGLLIHVLFDGNTPDPPQAFGTAFLFFGSLAFAFAISPKNLIESALFALVAGLVMGGLAFSTVRLEDSLSGVEFGFAAGVFATVIALPLFQAGFHLTWLATDYKLTHFHVWTDAVSAGGALAFTGLSWLMLLMLAQLLGLVGIHFIDTLLNEEWFGWMWSGGAFGAALGVLRNNLKVIGALQNVVLIVLSLLAVPLALALLIFLCGLLLSGGQALWDATDSATPVLLSCAAGCFVLANVIIRDDDASRSANVVLRATSLVLAAGILPLAMFAAISMGIRINQYGLAPERLWALVTIIIACAYGVAYWAALALGRWRGWTLRVREANLHLAAMSCLLALFLALPILDFGAMSARSQLARLEAGKVSAEDFDYAALRWDFGDAGRDLLAQMATGEGQAAQLAAEARDQPVRPSSWLPHELQGQPAFHVVPAGSALEEQVSRFLHESPWLCQSYCVALDLGETADGGRAIELVERGDHSHFRLEPLSIDCGEGTVPCGIGAPSGTGNREIPPLTVDSTVEIRTVPRRVIFVDGVAMERPLEDTPTDPGIAAPVIDSIPAE